MSTQPQQLDIQTMRAYEIGPDKPGYRVLVDRIWPRGVTKDQLQLDEWAKELAPSTELRQWFDHRADRWLQFRKRYRKELKSYATKLDKLRSIAAEQPLLLLYGAKDKEHNQAVVLREVLTGAGELTGE